jgi:hypothetical protein
MSVQSPALCAAAPYLKAIATPAARVRASWGAGPWGGVTAGEPAGQVLEVVARAGGRLEPGDDADRERVAADTGEVLAEQVSGSRGLARGHGGDHFDVMALQFVAWPAGCWSGMPVRAARSATARPKSGSALTARRRAAAARRGPAARCARRYHPAAGGWR